MNRTLFSRTGRLTRRDYALTMGTLLGGAVFVLSIAFYLLLSLSYTAAVTFFRDATGPFWAFLILGAALTITLTYSIFPLLAIPASIRRLHDIGCGGWLAFPLILASLLPIGLPVLSLIVLATLLTGMNRSADLIFFDSPNEIEAALAGFAFFYVLLVIVGILSFGLFAAWIFLKKGDAQENRYGAAPIEKELPSVRAAYFPTQGTVARRPFVMRTLILLAAAGILIPSLGQSILYPVVLILNGLKLLPNGMDFFVLLLTSDLFPLALLPLILTRLRTLGRSKWEAVLIYAPTLPSALVSWKMAAFLGTLTRIDENNLDSAALYAHLTISSDGGFFIGLSLLCGILALIGIKRLLHRDEEYSTNSLS